MRVHRLWPRILAGFLIWFILPFNASTVVQGQEILHDRARMAVRPGDFDKINEPAPLGKPIADFSTWELEAAGPQVHTTASLLQVDLSNSSVCADIWDAHPNEDNIPFWLSTPDAPEELATYVPYTYLAGQLIRNGLVDATRCTANGLLPNGYADPCGVDIARQVVLEWQNQFDPQIHRAAITAEIPAVLLKRIFAQETQFWFGESPDGIHYGPGHTTEAGLDPLFLYFPEYYDEVCPAVLAAQTCREKRYPELEVSSRAMIRGYFLSTYLNTSCSSCPNFYDPSKIPTAFDIYAKLLVANCQQLSNIILDITGGRPGASSNYVDLWKFTLGNYNAGSGCISEVVEITYQKERSLLWQTALPNFSKSCAGAKDYVANISGE